MKIVILIIILMLLGFIFLSKFSGRLELPGSNPTSASNPAVPPSFKLQGVATTTFHGPVGPPHIIGPSGPPPSY